MTGFLILPEGRQVAVEGDLVLGRVPACDIVIDDNKASRRHAVLRVSGSIVELEDLGSSNGTVLNGKPLHARRLLRDGDEIVIGRTVLVFREQAPAPAAAAAVPDELVFDDAPPPAPDELTFDEPEVPVAKAPPPPPPPAAAPPPPPPPPPPRRADAEPAKGRVETLEFLDEVVQVRVPSEPAARPAATAGRPQARAPGGGGRSGGVLQYHKREDRGGLLADDMDQMGGLKRFGLVLLALAVAGAMGYLAMRLARG